MISLKDKCIGVLMGGWSPEREISLRSGKNVAESLRRQGFRVVEIDVDRNLMYNLKKIDIAFIALHGVPGEDGTVQGMLEILGIPYTGSGVLASSICMNKLITKKVLMASGIRVPRHVEYQKSETQEIRKVLGDAPWIVKAVSSGSSLGVELVKSEGELESSFKRVSKEYGDIFIEEFIDGLDVQVGILGDEVLPVAEIRPECEFFDYYSKYTPGVTQEIIPARLPDGVYKEVQLIGLRSHRAVGCSGFSRVDMKLRGDEVYVLEINSIPGLTDISVLPAEAAHIGMSYDEVIYKILESAIKEG